MVSLNWGRCSFTTAVTCAVVLSCVLSVSAAKAAVRHVPDEYLTIQSAIDASAEGDSVLVAPGTYRGVGSRGIEFRGRNLSVIGVGGSQQTTLDCEQQDRGFYIHEEETAQSLIQGFCISNGEAGSGDTSLFGGGILCRIASPVIRDCLVRNCHGGAGGGMGFVISQSVVIGCVVMGNRANQYGGGLSSSLGMIILIDCIIAGNSATTGGGVYFSGGTVFQVSGCTITANVATGHSGGVLTYDRLELDRCIVWGNCSSLGDSDIRVSNEGAVIRCSLVDSAGVSQDRPVEYDEYCVFTDPEFCGPIPCGLHDAGDWTLRDTSPCTSTNSPCGELIGALESGCYATPSGACCLSDYICFVTTAAYCQVLDGTYLGDYTECDGDVCAPSPTRSTTWGSLKSRFVLTPIGPVGTNSSSR